MEGEEIGDLGILPKAMVMGFGIDFRWINPGCLEGDFTSKEQRGDGVLWGGVGCELGKII